MNAKEGNSNNILLYLKKAIDSFLGLSVEILFEMH
jgi:hypothetical protein